MLSCPQTWSIITAQLTLVVTISHLRRESISDFPLYCSGFSFHALWSSHEWILQFSFISCYSSWCSVTRLTPLVTSAHSTLSWWLLWIMGASCCHWQHTDLQPVLSEGWGWGWGNRFSSWPLVNVRHLVMEDALEEVLAFLIYKETPCNYQQLLDKESVLKCRGFHIFFSPGTPAFLLGLSPQTPYWLRSYC